MLRRWAGPLITILILGGVALVVVANLDLKGSRQSPAPEAAPDKPVSGPARSTDQPPSGTPLDFREYPIGEPQVRNHMEIRAVWLPPVTMEGMNDLPGSDIIHLEADIHATEGNPNGFAKDEFVPYLKVHYTVRPEGRDEVVHEGELLPMVARDGLHYGASLSMPRAGRYRLTYRIEPPSAGGLGRHADPATGVAPWWKPFEIAFDWDYQGLPKPR